MALVLFHTAVRRHAAQHQFDVIARRTRLHSPNSIPCDSKRCEKLLILHTLPLPPHRPKHPHLKTLLILPTLLTLRKEQTPLLNNLPPLKIRSGIKKTEHRLPTPSLLLSDAPAQDACAGDVEFEVVEADRRLLLVCWCVVWQGREGFGTGVADPELAGWVGWDADVDEAGGRCEGIVAAGEVRRGRAVVVEWS